MDRLRPIQITAWVTPDVYDRAYRIARRHRLSLAHETTAWTIIRVMMSVLWAVGRTRVARLIG